MNDGQRENRRCILIILAQLMWLFRLGPALHEPPFISFKHFVGKKV